MEIRRNSVVRGKLQLVGDRVYMSFPMNFGLSFLQGGVNLSFLIEIQTNCPGL